MYRARYPEIYEFDRELDDAYAEFDRESGLFESEFEGGWLEDTPPPSKRPGPTGTVSIGKHSPLLSAIRAEISRGNRDINKLTDVVFFKLHPERNGAKLSRGLNNDEKLKREWKAIYNLAASELTNIELGRTIEEGLKPLPIQ